MPENAGTKGVRPRPQSAARYVVLTLLAAGLAVAVVWAVTTFYCERLYQEGRVQVAALAATIASGVPAEAITSLDGGERSPAAVTLRSLLVNARQANPEIRRLYALLPGTTPSAWRFAIDGGAAPGGRLRYGEFFDIGARSAIEEARSGPTADITPTQERGGSWIGGYAPVRSHEGRTVAVLAVEVGAGTALAAERRFRLEACIALALVLGGIGFTGYDRYRKRRIELERNRNIHARLSIHRLAEVMTRPGGEADLVRSALDVMADATGFERWALFRRASGAFQVAATRGFEGAGAELHPDAIGSNVCSVPLLEDGEPVGILQCHALPGRGFEPDEVTLIRWMAGQLSQGLKRLQLESRDQLLASYMRSTAEMLIGFDLSGRLTYANPAARQALGEELQGRGLDSLFALPEHAGMASLFGTLRLRGGFSGELRCRALSDASFPVEATIAKAINRDGVESAWVLVGRDISDRRERENEIQSRSVQLELINEQLQNANERLAEGSRMKNEFLANTSHELRTPLNAVIGFATLLEQDIAENEKERCAFARSIRESAEHLLVVINDILDLAKVEAGRLEVALETEDAVPTILAAAETLKPMAERKGLGFNVSVPRGALEMRLDPARLRQVLLNLLGNAIKFTDKGEVTLEARRDENPDEVVIVVRDTGIGIATSDQARLFVKFAQVDGSFKRRHQGAGLGLVITKSLVQRMGGRISMESGGLGQGTRVTLAFPETTRSACLNES